MMAFCRDDVNSLKPPTLAEIGEAAPLSPFGVSRPGEDGEMSVNVRPVTIPQFP